MEFKESLEVILNSFKEMEDQIRERITTQYTNIVKDFQKTNIPENEYLISKKLGFYKRYIGDRQMFQHSRDYYGSSYEFIFGSRFQLPENKVQFKEALNRLIENKIKAERAKLIQTVSKYLQQFKNVVSVTEVSTKSTEKGFSGSWKIKTTNNEFLFSTDAIYAGGYNIQVLHVRYIVDVRDLTTKKSIKNDFNKEYEKISKQEKDDRRNEKDAAGKEKSNQRFIMRALRAVSNINKYYHEHLLYLTYHTDNANWQRNTQERIDQLKPLYDLFFVNKKPRYTKEQLTDMIKSGQITTAKENYDGVKITGLKN